MNFNPFAKKKDIPSAKLATRFCVKIERTISGGAVVVFDAIVAGYFTGKTGKPSFVTTSVVFDRMPKMNLRDMFPTELKSVETYAVNVMYPKLIGITK
jgi:hypothetical protein